MAKHIVIDARSRPSSTGRYVDRLIEHLQELDTVNRYTILLDPKDSWRPKAQNFAAVPCGYKKFSFNPLDQLTFGRFIKKLKPDLVHFAMTPQEPMLYRGKRVTTTHDLTMLRFTRAGRLPLPLHWLRMAGYKWTFKQSHRKSKAIIVPTEFVKKDLSAYQPSVAHKIVVTLEASEPPIPVEAVPLTGVRKPFIMHVGSPFPHKNIERLVDAFEILKADHPDLQLVLAGKKEYYFGLLEQYISSKKYKKDIIIPGFVSDAQLKWLYEHTEAYVLPSLSEGFGLPGLEAMAHGAPVASSNATCLPEVYETAAAYFNPFDIRHIAVVVNDILSNSVYANKLRTRGAERITCFSWKKMSEITFSLYQEAINKR
jgi:glycosyltransferase involved in cell wall biosynthesis